MSPVPEQADARAHGTHAAFPGTRWSVVLAAVDPSGPVFHEAINRLCQTYWFPVYAFARRSGHSPHDAADLTQSCFTFLLGMNHNTLKSALHRLRRDDFAVRLREQVRHTLANPSEEEIRDEIRHLFAAVA